MMCKAITTLTGGAQILVWFKDKSVFSLRMDVLSRSPTMLSTVSGCGARHEAVTNTVVS